MLVEPLVHPLIGDGILNSSEVGMDCTRAKGFWHPDLTMFSTEKGDQWHMTEREMKFANAAQMMQNRIYELDFWIDTIEPNFDMQFKEIIAQSLYDFAVHIIQSMHERMYNIMGPEQLQEFTVESCLKDIPDLPLPKEGE
jgi:hypothetical protein